MRRQYGFTLIELLIVMVVVAILAAIAVSSYREQVRKSRRTEAYNYVAQMQLGLERWRAENPCYGRTAPGGTASGCPTFTESGTYPTFGTSSYYTFALSGANMTTDYTIIATPQSSQLGDRCGVLNACNSKASTCSYAKPTWATSACN